MTNFAVTFPGQGSQSVGMLADLPEAYPLVKATFEEASDALGKNLWVMSQEGPTEEAQHDRKYSACHADRRHCCLARAARANQSAP